MAGANTTFKKASQEMQTEHQELMHKLPELDHALECLICYSEVFADLADVQQAHTTARWMAGWLPTHFLEGRARDFERHERCLIFDHGPQHSNGWFFIRKANLRTRRFAPSPRRGEVNPRGSQRAGVRTEG